MNYLSRIINDITTYFLTNPFIVVTEFSYSVNLEDNILLIKWSNQYGIGVRFNRDKLSSENYRSEIVSGVLCEINTTLYSIDDYLN